MIAKKFTPPNFRCRVTEPDRPSRRLSRLVNAKDAEAARTFLERRGYTVLKVQPYNFATWIAATKKLKAAAQRARGSTDPSKWRTYTFKQVWTPLKDVLLDLFDNKCAYCDASMTHVSWGDVEHFRPKGEVAGDPTHPGYYWLAYAPENYLPACSRCNQGDAKQSKFPVLGTRAFEPAAPLDVEQPALLNPYDDDFREHLQFVPHTDNIRAGMVEPRNSSKRGFESIKTYRLGRWELVDVRRDVQRNALQECKLVYANWFANDIKVEDSQLIQDCLSGRRQFAAAVMDEIEAFAAGKNQSSPFRKKN